MLSASYYQNWNFTTNNGFSTLRSDLLNSALFGNSGVVNRAVNFLPSTTTVTSSQLSGTDVVLYIAGGQTNSAELSVLKPFVESGGGLFVFGNNYWYILRKSEQVLLKIVWKELLVYSEKIRTYSVCVWKETTENV